MNSPSELRAKVKDIPLKATENAVDMMKEGREYSNTIMGLDINKKHVMSMMAHSEMVNQLLVVFEELLTNKRKRKDIEKRFGSLEKFLEQTSSKTQMAFFQISRELENIARNED